MFKVYGENIIEQKDEEEECRTTSIFGQMLQKVSLHFCPYYPIIPSKHRSSDGLFTPPQVDFSIVLSVCLSVWSNFSQPARPITVYWSVDMKFYIAFLSTYLSAALCTSQGPVHSSYICSSSSSSSSCSSSSSSHCTSQGPVDPSISPPARSPSPPHPPTVNYIIHVCANFALKKITKCS